MQASQSTKQLQQLTGKIATLNQFVSRSTNKCLPFCKILKKAFSWSPECDKAFQELNEYLVSPPLLSQPVEGEALYLYLAVSSSVISSALIREEQGVQKPVYFISKALHGAKERYPQIEKLAFALVPSARRLRPYFQAYTIKVLTEYPLRKILQKPDLSGRLVNWAIELGEFDIEFHLRASLKGKIGVVLEGPNGEKCEATVQLKFNTTNKEAEYKAMILGMNIAREMGVKNLKVRSDSQVVVGHIQGEYEARGSKMKKYLVKVKEIMEFFNKITFTKLPREENSQADALARMGSTTEEEVIAVDHPIQDLTEPSIVQANQVACIEEREQCPEWGHDILQFLKEGKLPFDNKLARKIRIQAARYTLVDRVLY
ncbi:uncharacterized protein LOC132185246 [Corylus avellana]|uniref:uncharacterized protein LOC132185246 n=1 Tax=Corylus avellana TaxID=13451 RepID=UPI00286B9013|nr:uncharacterized protein LOC132185246 [Corylus avellana]